VPAYNSSIHFRKIINLAIGKHGQNNKNLLTNNGTKTLNFDEIIEKKDDQDEETSQLDKNNLEESNTDDDSETVLDKEATDKLLIDKNSKKVDKVEKKPKPLPEVDHEQRLQVINDAINAHTKTIKGDVIHKIPKHNFKIVNVFEKAKIEKSKWIEKLVKHEAKETDWGF